MAVNKNFVVKNGLEVNSNLILADVDANSVGIGTSNIDYKLHVVGGIGATDLVVTGIATFPYISLTGVVAVGSSLGVSGQYLVRSGAGVTWQDLPAFRNLSTFTATPGQTVFFIDYTIGYVDIFINGVKLSSNEFTAVDGSTISLNQPCFGGETVELVAYSTVNPGYAFTGITGISVLEEGSVVGTAGSVLVLNFVGAAVTAIGSGVGVTVYITDVGGGESYWEETSVGINTISNVGIATTNPRFALEVGPVGYADTALWVNGNARVTGILTVGTASIVLDGLNNVINVGSGVTIDGSTGRIDATEFYASGLQVGIITAETIVYQGGITLTQDWTRTSAGIHTLSNVGIGTTNPTSALTVKGDVLFGNPNDGASQFAVNAVGDVSMSPGRLLYLNSPSTSVGLRWTNAFGIELYNLGSVGGDDRNIKISSDNGGKVTLKSSSNTLDVTPTGTIISGVSTFSGQSTFDSGIILNGNTSNLSGSQRILLSGGEGGDTQLYNGGTAFSSFIFNSMQGGSTIEVGRLNGSGTLNLPLSQGGINVSGVSTLGIVTAGNIYSTGIVTATSFSGSNTLKERSIATGVTTSIANNGIGNTNITGFKSYALMRVGLSTAGWLRIYTDSASRDADVSRSVGEDPAPGSGVIAEVVTTGISTTQIISPFVMGGNLDNPADTTIYASIKNLSGSTQAITANLTILQLEA
jgi:hypothetical protein